MGADLQYGTDETHHEHGPATVAAPVNADEESPLLSSSDSPEPKVKALTSVKTIVTVLLLGMTHLRTDRASFSHNRYRRFHFQCRFYVGHGRGRPCVLGIRPTTRCKLAVDRVYARTLCCAAHGKYIVSHWHVDRWLTGRSTVN